MLQIRIQQAVKLYVYALAVGIIAGFGAVVFRELIGLVHNLLFYGKFTTLYQANLHASISPWGLGIILVPMLGAICVVWLVKNFAPEAKGHGVPEVIDAIYFKQGVIRPSVALFKSLASAISIGSGGSVGREGPIVQIGSAFGSALGQFCKLATKQRIVLIAAGAAAGISATFNTPIGGIVFALELLLVSANALNIGIVALATVVATSIGRYFFGIEPAFKIPVINTEQFSIQAQLMFIPLGIALGLLAIFFSKSLYWCEDKFSAWFDNPYWRHLLGMLGVGILMVCLQHIGGHYYVQGIGYATIYDTLRQSLFDPWTLLALCAAKLLATCLTLGSGGSGGIFSPALFLGATFGTAFAILYAKLLPGHQVQYIAFALAGMAAMVAGTTGAILTAIIMLIEMTRDYNVVLPIIITAITAHSTRALLTRENIYSLKLLRRGRPVHEGLQAALLSGYKVKDIMRPHSSDNTAIQTIACHQDIALVTLMQSMHASDIYNAVIYDDASHSSIVGYIDERQITKFFAQSTTLMSEPLHTR